MILPVHDRFRARLAAVLQSLYQLPPDALPQLPIEYPPKRELGDLATPAAFELARRLRKAPRAIAQEIAAAFGSVDGIARVEAAPNGYLNVYLDRVAFALEQFVHQDDGRFDDRRSIDTIEDHRRTHGDQPEQGRAHRPPAQLGAGRHARPGSALPGRACRSPELHRRYGRPGSRRGRRIPGARTEGSRRHPAHRRDDAVRLLLLGSVRPRHPLV